MEVQAGLAPPNQLYLLVTPSWLASLYALTWTTGILTDPKFVTGVTPVSCTGEDCISVFLPGSLYNIRKKGTDRNATIFDRKYGDYTTLITHKTPGLHVEFSALEDPKNAFESKDCILHGQEELGDLGLYVCLSEKDGNMLAGKHIGLSIFWPFLTEISNRLEHLS